MGVERRLDDASFSIPRARASRGIGRGKEGYGSD